MIILGITNYVTVLGQGLHKEYSWWMRMGPASGFSVWGPMAASVVFSEAGLVALSLIHPHGSLVRCRPSPGFRAKQALAYRPLAFLLPEALEGCAVVLASAQGGPAPRVTT